MALEGDVGCRAIFSNHLPGILKVEVEDEGILLDIDNPQDYERLRGEARLAMTNNGIGLKVAPGQTICMQR